MILLGAYATFENLYDREGRSEEAETWRAKVDPKFLAGVEANRRRSGNPYD